MQHLIKTVTVIYPWAKNATGKLLTCRKYCVLIFTHLSTTLKLLCTNYTVFQSMYLTQFNTIQCTTVVSYIEAFCCSVSYSIPAHKNHQCILECVICETYKVIKKSLCTWWLQYRKLQVMFKVSPASLQTFIDTPNCVLKDRVQYSRAHIPNVWNGWNMSVQCWWNTNSTKWSPHRKTSPSATSSTTNPTSEKGLCSEKSLMNCLSYGTALIALMNKNST
jgi:hypothetical protein